MKKKVSTKNGFLVLVIATIVFTTMFGGYRVIKAL